MLVHIPTEQGDSYVNPDHVVEARHHAPTETLRLLLVTGAVLAVRDSEVEGGLASVLADLGHGPSIYAQIRAEQVIDR